MPSGSKEALREKAAPLGPVALLALLLVVAPWLLPSGVGAYRMFTTPVLYRLDVAVQGADGFPRRVPLRVLEPHLGRDARRVVGNARRYSVGETNAALLARGLEDLARLVCVLHPDAESARLVYWRRSVDETPLDRIDRTWGCAER